MKFKIIPTLAYISLLVLLLSLSNWQWQRSKEKRSLLDLQEQTLVADAIHLSSAIPDDPELLRYRKVHAKGHYDAAHQFLIDNQINAGTPGYFVMTPFLLDGADKAVLVNRGWVPLIKNRAILPEISINKVQMVINGRINKFLSVGVKLAGSEISTNGWPSVVQIVDSNLLSKKLGYPLFHFQIELDENLPEGFKRTWQNTALMPPEQHIAYALQWLGLALTLTVLFTWNSFKNKND